MGHPEAGLGWSRINSGAMPLAGCFLPTTPITQDRHESPVLATADGELIEFVVVDKTAPYVPPISETLASKLRGKQP